ncbi:MAG: ATP-binding protein [Usitatibacteraceae bacterium]
MSSKLNRHIAGAYSGLDGSGEVTLDATPFLSDALLAFAESIPWPVIVVDDSGNVAHFNNAMRATNCKLPTPGLGSLRSVFPDYFAALRGDPSWLTQQEVVVSRSVSPSLKTTERIWLRRLPKGAYLIVMDETRLQHLESAHAQTARLASLGFMLASVSHEISNPLTAVHSILQVLQTKKASGPETLEKGLRNIASSVRRILAITRKLNVFARVGNETATSFPIDAAIEEASTLFGYDSMGETTELLHEHNPDAWVFGQPDHIQQIFHNIFLNAAQAMRGKGSISVKTQSLPDSIEISIRDSGPGIAPEALAKVFDPFFTTKPSGEGTGLGLAISHEIAHEHNGSIRAENHAAGGALFVVTLPRHHKSRPANEAV